MPSTVRDILHYIATEYPHKEELSKGRSTKLVYLCDWRHVLQTGEQATPISWRFDNYGPFVWDVYDAAKEYDKLFRIDEVENMYGSKKTLIVPLNSDYQSNITQSQRDAADHVISQTKNLNWDDFIKLVYSTYPVVSSEKYSSLDLPKLATEYKKSSMYQGS